MAEQVELTLGERLLALAASLREAFTQASKCKTAEQKAAAEKALSEVYANIDTLDSLVRENKKTWDLMLKMRDTNAFGKDFCPTLEYFVKPGRGRKASAPKEDPRKAFNL